MEQLEDPSRGRAQPERSERLLDAVDSELGAARRLQAEVGDALELLDERAVEGADRVRRVLSQH